MFLSAPCDLPWWWAFFQCGIFHCCKKENLKNLVASLMKILSKFGKLFLNVKIARFIYMVQVHNQNCIRIFKFFLIILGLGPRCFFWCKFSHVIKKVNRFLDLPHDQNLCWTSIFNFFCLNPKNPQTLMSWEWSHPWQLCWACHHARGNAFLAPNQK